jgi:hypothetical protein
LPAATAATTVVPVDVAISKASLLTFITPVALTSK